jgi:hypothetical protein
MQIRDLQKLFDVLVVDINQPLPASVLDKYTDQVDYLSIFPNTAPLMLLLNQGSVLGEARPAKGRDDLIKEILEIIQSCDVTHTDLFFPKNKGAADYAQLLTLIYDIIKRGRNAYDQVVDLLHTKTLIKRGDVNSTKAENFLVILAEVAFYIDQSTKSSNGQPQPVCLRDIPVNRRFLVKQLVILRLESLAAKLILCDGTRQGPNQRREILSALAPTLLNDEHNILKLLPDTVQDTVGRLLP